MNVSEVDVRKSDKGLVESITVRDGNATSTFRFMRPVSADTVGRTVNKVAQTLTADEVSRKMRSVKPKQRTTTRVDDTIIALPHRVLSRVPSWVFIAPRNLRQHHVAALRNAVGKKWESRASIQRKSGLNDEYLHLASAYLQDKREIEVQTDGKFTNMRSTSVRY